LKLKIKANRQYIDGLGKYMKIRFTVNILTELFFPKSLTCLRNLSDKMEKEEYKIRLGARISELRTKSGISQFELSLRAGIADSSMRNIEKGRTNPTIGALINIAKGLNVEMKDLFDFEK